MDTMNKLKVIILGSTGSIGKQTLNVCRRLNLEVEALSCASNVDLLYEQILEFKPSKVAVTNNEAAISLKKKLAETSTETEVLIGRDGTVELAKMKCDRLVMAIIGFAALQPLIAAIKAKQTIAMANKETIVASGKYIFALVKKHGAKIYPVDSEPSAIWQCLTTTENPIEKLILTASGGPFKDLPFEEFAKITVAEALDHPIWSMGKKITIDSATMMNKGLELIEVCHLFDVKTDQVEVLVHPEGIVHSMVEFEDGALLAQMGLPDMELPIQYAITYPHRLPMPDKAKANFSKIGKLTFHQPDLKKFKSLALAYQASNEGGAMPAVLNAANEIAVEAFFDERIQFIDIPVIVEKTMISLRSSALYYPKNIDDILAADNWARLKAKSFVSKI